MDEPKAIETVIAEPSIGDAVVFRTYTRPTKDVTGMVVGIGMFENESWGKRIVIMPDEPIEGYEGEVIRHVTGFPVEMCRTVK